MRSVSSEKFTRVQSLIRPSALVVFQAFWGGFGGYGGFGSSALKTDEEIEKDVTAQVPPGLFFHTPNTIPSKLRAPRSWGSYGWGNRMEPTREILRIASERREERNSFLGAPNRQNAAADFGSIDLEEAINIRRCLLQQIHPLNSPARKRGLTLMQNAAASIIHLIMQTMTTIEKRIASNAAAVSQWRVLTSVFQHLVGQRLNEWSFAKDTYSSLAISDKQLRATMSQIEDVTVAAASPRLLIFSKSTLTVDADASNRYKWFSNFPRPSFKKYSPKDRFHLLQQSLKDWIDTEERGLNRSRKGIEKFVELIDSQILEKRRKALIKKFLKEKPEELLEARTDTFEKKLAKCSEAAVVGADRRSGIPLEFAQLFENDAKCQRLVTVDSFDDWMELEQVSGSRVWVPWASDPALHINNLYQLETGTICAVATMNAMLEILTQPKLFDKLFDGAVAPTAPQWERPPSLFHFFCDQVLANVAKPLREFPELVTLLLEKIPFMADVDKNVLHAALADPTWAERRIYIWTGHTKPVMEKAKLEEWHRQLWKVVELKRKARRAEEAEAAASWDNSPAPEIIFDEEPIKTKGLLKRTNLKK